MELKRFFATFPAGCFDIIARQLKTFTLSELKIAAHDDSSVTFQSSLPTEQLIELRYFTNIYLVFDKPEKIPKSSLRGKYYRLMLLRDGSPQPMNQNERTKLETKLKQELRLEPNAHLSKNDFYLIERSSGKKLFTLRLPRAKFKREKLSAGELRPELADLLCITAGVRAKHIVLDMFAGYGSIPYEAVRGFGCKQVIGIDNQKLANRHEHPSIRWYEADARSLDFLEDSSIDRIVTDPPWGIFNKADNLNDLYREMLKEAYRVMKSNSVMVILSGNRELEKAVQNSNLKTLKNYPVLVSGKKANILKLQKAT